MRMQGLPPGSYSWLTLSSLPPVPPRSSCPVYMDYKTAAENESMYNTPPCWAIYVCGLVFDHLLKKGEAPLGGSSQFLVKGAGRQMSKESVVPTA